MKIDSNKSNPLPSLAESNANLPFVFGANVRRLRKENRMSIAMFARVCGLTRPTVYKVEDGLSDLKLSMICTIADALDVSVVDLLTPHDDDVDPDYYKKMCEDQRALRQDKKYSRKIRRRIAAQQA